MSSINVSKAIQDEDDQDMWETEDEEENQLCVKNLQKLLAIGEENNIHSSSIEEKLALMADQLKIFQEQMNQQFNILKEQISLQNKKVILVQNQLNQQVEQIAKEEEYEGTLV